MAWDAYIRVSTIRGRSGDSFISPDVQRASIERWATGRGVDVVWNEPEFISGATLERPILERILQRIWAGESEGVVVWKLSRLSRAGAGDALVLIKKIIDAGAGVVAVEDGVDPATTSLVLIKKIIDAGAGVVAVEDGVDPATTGGKIATGVMLLLAEIELDAIKEGWLEARQRANARGVFIGSVPIGFDRQADGTLAVNETDAEHVRRAFRISAGLDPDAAPMDLGGGKIAIPVGTIGSTRGGLRAVLDYMRGVYPDRYWTITVAEKLIKQRLYLGRMAHGEFVTTFPELAIVNPMLWELAQHERPVSRRTKLAPDFPLVGIATCGNCARGLVAQWAKDRHGVKSRRYRCIGCDAPANFAAGPLEAIMLDAVREHPPTLSTDEMSARNAARLAAEAALNTTMATREQYAELGDLDRWAELVAERDNALRVARLAADATSTAPLPDLADPSPAELRAIAERAIGSLVVAKGRAPIAERVTLVLS